MLKPDFPRKRVVLRAAMRMRTIVMESLMAQFVIALGGALIAGVLAALNPPSAALQKGSVPWLQVLAFAVLAGVVMLLFVWASIWLWQLVAYRLQGRRDSEWDAGEAWMQSGHVSFKLDLREGVLPTSSHGRIECRVKPPGTPTLIVPYVSTGLGFMGECSAQAGIGRYEVRWYGSTKRGKFYEITRAIFDIDDFNGGKYVAVTKKSLRGKMS